MVRIDDFSNADMDQMALDHYNNLNPMTALRIRKVGGVRKSTQRLSHHSLIHRIRTEHANTVAQGKAQETAFWNYLLANQYAKLKEIITGRPPALKAIIAEIDLAFGKTFMASRKDYEHSNLNTFGKTVAEVFNYQTLYRSKDVCVDNCDSLSLGFCTYCNAVAVEILTIDHTVTGEQLKYALLQLDHFYPQSRFPYLALSFFNLVPGCNYCNGPLKREKDFDIDTHFNPFHNRLDDHFKFTVSNVKPKNKMDFTIGYGVKHHYSLNALQDFKIIERYNQRYKTEAFNTLNKMSQRTTRIRLSLIKQIPKLFNSETVSYKTTMDAFGIPVQASEINQHALGKLKRDICIQLGML